MRNRNKHNRMFGGVVTRGGRVRGFTLVELIVAVGAVALLTVGVGQVFQAVGSLVSTGSSIAEIEQLARAIESQMRKDFDALNRMREDEVFMAIRCRRVGDVDLDGTVTPDTLFPGYDRERALYLTSEDRESDQKNGLLPYEAGSTAVTRRLDEIIFLGFGGDGGLYHSYTPTCKEDPVTDCEACVRDISSDTVRIYYGHGLRPAIDATESGVGVDSLGRLWRSYIPDGDFGTPVGLDNRYDPSGDVNGGLSMGRNELAGDWPLLRHAMLLYGGSAAGAPQGQGVDESIICNDREYAPYIRDAETFQRFNMVGQSAYTTNWAIVNPGMSGNSLGDPLYNPDNASRPRAMQFGRVDICAQSPEEAQRWLEGFDPIEGIDASAFDDGRYDVSKNNISVADQDLRLWEWGTDARLDIGVFSSIAGCFARYMCETEPPIVNRGDEESPDDACDSIMDTHAVLAARCSNFEVAWSDPQSRWRANTPPALPGALDQRMKDRLSVLEPGDVIWYDYDFPRRFLVPLSGGTQGFTDLDPNPTEGRQTDPEVLDNELVTAAGAAVGFWREGRLEINGSDSSAHSNFPPPMGNFVGYDWRIAGGAHRDEYMAVFPYRVPDIGVSSTPVDDRYLDQAFAKPQFIRIRMTLHDSQMRLKEGKDFEFIFLVDMQ